MTKKLQSLSKEHIGTLLLFLVAIIWGSGFIAVQVALDAQMSPSLLMMMRFLISTLVMGAIFWKRILANFRKKDLIKCSVTGVFLFLGFYVQTVGLKYTTLANNAFLTATNVVMVPLIWWAISKKRPENRIFISSLLCLVGIGLLSYKLGQGIAFSVGDLLTLACALFFACQIVATSKLATTIDSAVFVFTQFAVCALLSIVVFITTDGDLTPLTNANGSIAVFYSALFATCACYFMQSVAQKYVSASKAAIIMGCEALFGTMFSVILGYDNITATMVLGGTVIMIALVLTEWNPKAKNMSSPTDEEKANI